ncbi:MAG: diguanylate cyclase [Candidatus Cloacimonadota bacterium]|nr:MAG: diguanylate cyclase [Candidatus Cloacimonadota bacterium]
MKKRLIVTLYFLIFITFMVLSILGKLFHLPGNITIIIGFILSALFLFVAFVLLKYDPHISILFWLPTLVTFSNSAIQLTGGISQSMLLPLYFLLILLVMFKSEIRGLIITLSLIFILEVSSAFVHQKITFHFSTIIVLFIGISLLISLFVRNLKRSKKHVEKKLDDMEKTTSVLTTPVSMDNETEMLRTFKYSKEGVDLKANEKMKEFIKPILTMIFQTIPSYSSVLFLKDAKNDSFFLFLINSHSAYINNNAVVTRKTGTYNWVIKEREPLINGQFLADSTFLEYYSRDEDVRSLIMVPLMDESVLIGLLICDNKDENIFNWETKEKLKVFSNMIVSTITLFKKIYFAQKAVFHFLTLDKITKEVSKDLETDSVLNNLSDIAQQAFNFDLLVLIQCKDNTEPVIIRTIPSGSFNLAGKKVSIDNSLAGFVIKKNHEIIKQQKINTPYFFIGEKGLDGYQSFFGVPMRKDEAVVGELVLLNESTANFSDEDKEPIKFLADLTYVALEKAKLYEEVKALSIRDGLTGAFNHRYFQEKLADEIRRVQRSGLPFAILMFDIDNFKKFNDTYGHQIGDSILKHLAEIVMKSIREIDIFARYGGEEFIILLPDTEKEGALEVAEKIRLLIEIRPLNIHDIIYPITVSIGCAVFPSDGEDKNTLIKSADDALYSAKQEGRNCVRTAGKL